MMKLEIIWKIPIIIPTHNIKQWNKSILFNKKENKSFLNKIGGIENLDLFPTTCDPTNIFYQSIRQVKEQNNFYGNKLPFTYSSGLSNSTNTLNLKIHLYKPNLIILSIKLNISNFSLKKIDDLHALKEIKNHTEIFNLLKTIYGLLISGDYRNFKEHNSLPTTYPHIKINTASHRTITDKNTVEVVTGHRDTTAEIIKKVLKKNKDHQINKDLILIDKQGIFARIDSQAHASERKTESASNLFELALVLFISFSKNLQLINDKNNVIKELIKDPQNIITKSITVLNTWNLLLIEFKLNKLIENYLTSMSKFSRIINYLYLKKLVGWILAGIGTILVTWITLFLSDYYNKKDKIKLIEPVDQTLVVEINKTHAFTWEGVKGAAYYVISINKYNSKKDQWENIFPNNIKTSKTNKIQIDINSTGKYQWHVVAKDTKKEAIYDSEKMEFQSTY